MLFQVPRYGRLVKTYDELSDTCIVHLAVQRKNKYWHHFIISDFGYMIKKRIQYDSSPSNFFTGPGQVVEDDLTSNEDIKEAIRKGKLYIIEAPDYPKTNEEIEEVKIRWQEVLGDQEYDLGYHNCEHLVTYILTGKAKSEQIQNASHSKMAIVDFISCTVCHGKRNLLKGSFSLSYSSTIAIPVIILKTKMFEIMTIKSVSVGVDISSKMFLHYVCQNGNIFAVSAAHCSMFCSGIAALFCTGFIEGCFAFYIIRDLNQKMKAGKIATEDFDREKWKTVGEAISTTVCTVVGALIGQWFIPIPILGYVGGAIVGNFVGRLIGVIISGKVYDLVVKKDKKS